MRGVRSGFTLIELLTVSAITSVTISMLLPAVQDAREEARRVQCAKQLTTVFVGSAMYEDAFAKMPPLTTGDGPTFDVNLSDDQNTGALAYILPFIGEQALFDLMPEIATQPELFLDGDKFDSFSEFFLDDGMFAAINEKRESLICPSNAEYNELAADRLMYGVHQSASQSGLTFIFSLDISETGPNDFGRSSYLPSLGGFNSPINSNIRGIAISQNDASGPMRNRTTSIPVSALGDGASNTICWSESLGFNNDFVFGEPTIGVNPILLSPALITGHRWLVETNPNVSILFGNSENSLHWLIGSNHPGGNNVAMCDGSVRFTSTSTSRGVMTALGCGNDGWIVPRK